MLAIALYYFVTATYAIPQYEDWTLVPAVTGHEHHLLSWLWSQNNEHRVPLPRLVLLLVLRAAHANFRSGMLLNIGLMALLAAAMMLAVRSFRGGETRYSDAFFPVAALNIGHWENLYWSWQLTFVLAVFLAGILLLVLLSDPEMRERRSAYVAGAALIAEPLCGGTGLLYVPLLALWTLWLGIRALRGRVRGGSGIILVVSAVFSLVLSGVYFVSYHRPEWTILHAGVWERLIGVGEVLTFGFGAGTRTLRLVFVPLTLALLLGSAWNVIRGIRAEHGLLRIRLLGITVFLATGLGYAAALGWGRAAVVRDVYNLWPTRYMLLVVPLLYAVYMAWDIYGPRRQRAFVQVSLFALSLLLLPLNTVHGLRSTDWSVEPRRAMLSDLNRTVPDFANRHHRFLAHMVPVQDLAASIRMLRQVGRWPFTQLRDDAPEPRARRFHGQEHPAIESPQTTVRYTLDGATDAIMVWGINGWQPLSGGPPQGTILDGGSTAVIPAKIPLIADPIQFVAGQPGEVTPQRRPMRHTRKASSR
jgi:hypothetical protein